MKKFLPWLVLFVTVYIFDTYSTHYIIQSGGEEANPLMRRAYDHSPYLFFLIKTALIVFAAGAFYKGHTDGKWIAMRGLIGVSVVGLILMCYHLFLLFAVFS